MPARATTLGLRIVVALAVGAPACAAPTAEPEPVVDDHAPPPPTSAVATPIVSSVDCTLREETAYVAGRARKIQTIRVGGKAITKATGHAFLAMQRAADAAGVHLALTSGFRTMAEQEYLYDCYLTGRCNNGNLAARPGYSNHQSGLAVDVTTSAWLAANAGRFGFVRTVPSEPWHWEFDGQDPGGVCDAVSWVSPKDGGWYTNGVWLKARAKEAARVAYWAGPWKLGESTDAEQDFALRYTFSTLGNRELTVRAYASSGAELGNSTISVRLVP